MAAEVTGQIIGADGPKDVILNNAATEATLRALLAATAGTREGITKAMELAAKAGLDPSTVAQVGEGLNNVSANGKKAGTGLFEASESSKKLKGQFDSLLSVTSKLADGTASLSGLLGSMSALFPGKIGIIVESFAALAEFQEKSLASYRALTSAGANFGGSLTDMRMAAANSYLTLKEFTDIVKNNSTTLAKMGGSVDDGVRSFALLNQSLITSSTGQRLMALGYTAEDVSNGMLSFINATGGRSAAEMNNMTGLTTATGEYLNELDKLSKLSGITRKQQEEDQKKAASNAAYQRALSNMSEEQKVRAEIGRQAAANSGIAGAQDAFMLRIAGLPPITKDAQQFVGIFGQAANGVYQMADQARSASGTIAGVEQGLGNFNEGVVDGVKRIGTSGDVLSYTNQTVNSAGLRSIQLQKQGAETAAGTVKLLEEQTRTQIRQGQSQAAAASDTANSLKSLGANILSVGTTIFGTLAPALNGMVNHIVATSVVIGGLLLTMKAFNVAMGASSAASTLAKSPIAGKLVTMFGEYGHSPGKPLWVSVVGGGLGSNLPGAAGGGSGGAGKIAKYGGGAAVAGFGAYEAFSAISDINKQISAGTISESEAKSKKAETVGGGVGSVAGTLSGAVLGEMAGVALAPFTGGISLIAGPLIGEALGSVAGKSLGEWIGKKSTTDEAKPTDKNSSPENDAHKKTLEFHAAKQTALLEEQLTSQQSYQDWVRNGRPDASGNRTSAFWNNKP